ncbi:MAG: hypothetical protein U0638_00530 [Phycisphaerales bacterium]
MKQFRVAVGSVWLVCAYSARAEVVTFESLDGLHNPQYTLLEIDGLRIQSDTSFFTVDEDLSDMFVHNASSVTLAKNYGASELSLSRIDGGLFDLHAFDEGALWRHAWNGGPSAETLVVTGHRPSGELIVREFDVIGGWDRPFVHLIASGLTGLDRVTFDGTGYQLPAAFQLDNIDITPVPSPAGGGVMLGAGAVAAVRRRRA